MVNVVLQNALELSRIIKYDDNESLFLLSFPIHSKDSKEDKWSSSRAGIQNALLDVRFNDAKHHQKSREK